MKKILAKAMCGVLLTIPQLTFGQQINTGIVDQWAVADIYQAEVAKLIPSNWEEVLHKVITQDQINVIREKMEIKLEGEGLNKHYSKEMNGLKTRGEIINFYFDVIKQYGIEGISQETDAVDYMQKAGIIQGDQDGKLNLMKDCTLQEAIVFGNRTLKHVYQVIDSGAKGLLWEVSDEDNTVYLLGTVHVGVEEMYPISYTLEEYIKNVDKIAFEVLMDDQEGMYYLQQKQLYLDGTTLDNYIPGPLYKETVEVFEKLGIPEEMVKQFKPWALANTLVSLMASNLTNGVGDEQVLPSVDLYVYTNALLYGKELLEIEGIRYQADLMDEIGLEIQIENLESAIEMVTTENNTISEEMQQIEQFKQYFINGDEEGFEDFYDKDQLVEKEGLMAQIMFDKRDNHMSQMVLGYLSEKDQDYMVVVGAGHMVGEKGIIQRLKDAGYNVKSVE